MIDNRKPSHTDIIDAVLDVKHDLGKYIRMPMVMLPEDAGEAEVRAAVLAALQRTRSGPRGDRSAREIWAGFRGEVAAVLEGGPAFDALALAVDRALAWEARAAGGAAIERGAVEADLAAVGARIQELLDEVSLG
jgi:hypothetical protein